MERGKIAIHNRSDYITDRESIKIVSGIMEKPVKRTGQYHRLTILDGAEITYSKVRKGDSFTVSNGEEKNLIIIHNCSDLSDKESVDKIYDYLDTKDAYKQRTQQAGYMILYTRFKTSDVFHVVGGQ